MGSILEEATKDMAAIKSGSASKGQKKAAAVAEEEGAKKLLSEVKKPKMEEVAGGEKSKTAPTTEAAQKGTLHRFVPPTKITQLKGDHRSMITGHKKLYCCRVAFNS